MRQTSRALCEKFLRNVVLLLQCSESESARKHIGCFGACIEPVRRASRVCIQLLLLCEKVSQPLNQRWSKETEMLIPCVLER